MVSTSDSPGKSSPDLRSRSQALSFDLARSKLAVPSRCASKDDDGSPLDLGTSCVGTAFSPRSVNRVAVKTRLARLEERERTSRASVEMRVESCAMNLGLQDCPGSDPD